MECPADEKFLNDELNALIYLYNVLRPSRVSKVSSKDAARTTEQCLSGAARTLLQMSQEKFAYFRAGIHYSLTNTDFLMSPPPRVEGDMCSEDFVDIIHLLTTNAIVGPAHINLAASAYLEYRINEAGVGDNYERLSRYFYARPVGCELGACQIELDEKRGPAYRPGTSPRSAPDSLRLDLDKREADRVFVYSVTPKQLAERTSDSSAINRLSHLMASAGLSGLGAPADLKAAFDFVRETRDREETLRRNPLVVGFGSSNPVDDTDEGRKVALFGWLLSPPADGAAPGGAGHVAVERTLTATLSLPSWWRSAKITIRSCWIPLAPQHRPRVKAARELFKYCAEQNGGESSAYQIDLPGTVAEISRALGIEVRQEPYLNGGREQLVEIGRPAQIVLEGGRLWRGTVVVLGNYLKADRIEVTPDMQGIIATFDCISPPPDLPSEMPLLELTGLDRAASTRATPRNRGTPQGQASQGLAAGPEVKPGLTEVTIWTSEGHTTAAMVKVMPFRTFAVSDTAGQSMMAETPCWLKERNAALQGSSEAPAQ
jgi:hypothetical protein